MGSDGTFVAEERTELIQPARLRFHQQRPVVVARLVAHVTEQRPVRLVHGGAFPFLVTGQETRWHENVTIKETFTS